MQQAAHRCVCGLTKAYMESVVHRPLEIIVMLPKTQYVQRAINGMYKSGALTSWRGGLKGWPPAICTKTTSLVQGGCQFEHQILWRLLQ